MQYDTTKCFLSSTSVVSSILGLSTVDTVLVANSDYFVYCTQLFLVQVYFNGQDERRFAR